MIGLGKVVYGPSSLSVEDAFNVTDHAIQLTGLSPGTTYQFTASNVHAIDGNDLASQSGQFTTAGIIPNYAAQVQQPINTDGTSVFSVRRGVIPLRFTLTLDGVPTCDLPAATIAVTRTAGGVIGPIDESVYTGPADNGSTFRIDSCQYVYVLSASALGVGTYRVDVVINAQVVGSATFGLR